jgi:hypothetical protein
MRFTKLTAALTAVACTAAAALLAVAIATDGGPDSPEGVPKVTSEGERRPSSALVSTPSRVTSEGEHHPLYELVSTHERVRNHEALPCTGSKEPINFEIFSAGPSVAGVPLTDFTRRCGGTTPVDEPPANLTNYIYGHCEIAEGATGCAPPLEIQTWPACQRAFADYSFEGEPLPHRRLPDLGGAEVVEFLMDGRIEVYTKSSTVVIFAENPAIAREALTLLRSQETGKPPATQAEELQGKPEEGLEPPSDGAMEGELSCQS